MRTSNGVRHEKIEFAVEERLFLLASIVFRLKKMIEYFIIFLSANSFNQIIFSKFAEDNNFRFHTVKISKTIYYYRHIKHTADMKKVVLATGTFYECGKNERMCHQLLDRLDREKPYMVLVEDSSATFGTIISVHEETEKRASISRFDISYVRRIMEKENKKSLMAKVESVNYEENSFNLVISYPENKQIEENTHECLSWHWDGPLMDLPMGMQETRTAINVLEMALADDSRMKEDTTLKYLNMLVGSSRCDVSHDSFVAMKKICHRLLTSKSPKINGFYSTLFHTMLTLGSELRITEFTTWWQELRESEEAFNMTKAWMDALPYNISNQEMTERIESELTRIDNSLKLLPLRLYRHIGDMGEFMHQMIYLSFSREAIQKIFSELMLREMLMERHEEYKLTKVTKQQPSPDMNNAIWQVAKDERWIDDSLQPLLSRSQSALVAYYIAEHLQIRNKWKFFENLWGRRNMKNDYYEALEQRQTAAMLDNIKRVFGEM